MFTAGQPKLWKVLGHLAYSAWRHQKVISQNLVLPQGGHGGEDAEVTSDRTWKNWINPQGSLQKGGLD